MRFGLDRMHRMMTVLGSPQRSYDTIHVVGTNGKTSTTRMIAAILQRHGLRTAAYTSPHLISYRERLQIGERDLRAGGVRRGDLACGVGGRARQPHARRRRPRDAVRTAYRRRAVGDRRAARAGRRDRGRSRRTLRRDVDDRVARDRADERRPGAHPLARSDGARHRRGEARGAARPGPRSCSARSWPARRWLSPSAWRRSAARASSSPRRAPDDPPLRAGGELSAAQLRARARRRRDLPARDRRRARASGRCARPPRRPTVSGRLQVVGDDPLTVLDGAHNPDAVQALVQALPET